MNIRYVLSALFLFLGGTLFAQGIEFFDGSWEEALAKAKKESKIIFVDAYAEWCGPCKRMAKDVFTQKQVGDFHNKNFINVKLDMEKGEGLTFRKKYPVSAFPTLFYIDYNGELVRRAIGAQQATSLLELGQSALGSVDYSGQYAEAYEAGKRDPDLIYNYVKALNNSGKSSLKVANEYLREQKDLTEPENLKIIFEGTVEADSRIFKLLVENRAAVESLFGKEEVENRIEEAAQRTLEKALEYDSEMLLEESKSKMADHHMEGTLFGYHADMVWAHQQEDTDLLEKAVKQYVKKGMKEDNGEQLHYFTGLLLSDYKENKKLITYAQDMAEVLVEKRSAYDSYVMLAEAHYYAGDVKDAKIAAQKAIGMAREEGRKAEFMTARALKKILE